MTDYTDAKLEKAVQLLPKPLFRPMDIHRIAVLLGFQKAQGATIWAILAKRGWIIRTGRVIGNAKRKFWWERMPR